MANGVGIIAVVAGSVPRIPGPRPADPSPSADRPASGPAEARDSNRPRSRPGSPAAVRPREASGGPAAARSIRPADVAGPARPERVTTSPSVVAKDVVRRTAEALGSAPLRDGSRIRIALRPAHLGELIIELSVSGSRVRARIRTETGAARDLILAHLDDLRREFERRGLRIGRFDVDFDGAPRHDADGAAGPARPKSHRRQVLDLEA
jgi:hypothetical protein